MTRKQLASGLDIACDTCQAQLPEYVRRELAGEPVATLFPAVAYHIDTCPACEALYFRLFQTQGMQMHVADLRNVGDRQGIPAPFDRILAELPAAPDWDEQPVAQGRAWYDRATKRLRQLEIQLAGIFARPTRGPAEVLTGLQGTSMAPNGGAAQSASIAEAELEMTLRVLPDPAGDAATCRIEVAVSLEDRFGDYSGVEVTLVDAAGERTAVTDEDGKAYFDGVPRDESAPLGLSVRLPE